MSLIIGLGKTLRQSRYEGQRQQPTATTMAPPGSKSNHRVFGQATRSNNKGSRYQRQLGGGGGNRYPSNNGSGKSHSLIASDDVQLTEQQRLAQRRVEYKKRRQQEGEELDFKFGYERFSVSTARPGETKRGWLFNLLPTVRSNNDDVPTIVDFRKSH